MGMMGINVLEGKSPDLGPYRHKLSREINAKYSVF